MISFKFFAASSGDDFSFKTPTRISDTASLEILPAESNWNVPRI
jgi:hypothetical protein